MKFFVSGKIGHEDDAKSIMQLLQKVGHEIVLDWTSIPHLRPYEDNTKESKEAAIEESQAVKAADVLILVPHERGVGMYVELGIAIGAGIPIRVIMDKKEPATMFFYHPLVKRVSSVQEIIEEFRNQSTIAPA